MEAVDKITPENGYLVTVDQAIRLEELGCDCNTPTIWQAIDWFETQGVWCWVECMFGYGHIKPDFQAHIAHYRDGKFEIYSDLEGLDETKYQIYEAMIDCALTLLENKREQEGK